MNEVLIENWNSVVKPDDLVYHLGDVGMHEPSKYLKRLNGKKVLIKGNHDSPSQMKGCFEQVLDSAVLEIGGNKVNLSHYPYRENVGPYDGKFIFKMTKDDGKWLLHGHTHNSTPKIFQKSINLSVEHWNYKPASEWDIIDLMKEAVE